jgi:ribonuclease HII
MSRILGIDEVGRGPWAGPLVVGAVVLDEEIPGLNDSKKLSAKKREELAFKIRDHATYGLGWVSSRELDRIGLSPALKLAARRAVENIPTDAYDEIIIDGTINLLVTEKDSVYMAGDETGGPSQDFSPKVKESWGEVSAGPAMKNSTSWGETLAGSAPRNIKNPQSNKPISMLIKADSLIPAVSAASILAKVARDFYMTNLTKKYPQYGFEKHAGYGTAFHKSALEKYSPCPEHRNSFAPIKKLKNTTKIGQNAENLVVEFLRNKGHEILTQNWKTKLCEIDIISTFEDKIYFTEVKYRKNTENGSALESITKKKQRQMALSVDIFLKKNHIIDKNPVLAVAAVEGVIPQITDFFELD